MKLEAGKFYRTRDGRKARIYAVDGAGQYPAHGAILCDSVWFMSIWTAYGSSDFRGNGTVGDVCDLVSEWTEPKPRLLAYRVKRFTDTLCGKYRVGSTWLFPESGPESIREPSDIWERVPHLDSPEER